MSRLRKCIAAVVMTIAASSASQATVLHCAGKLAEMLVYADGRLMVLSTWRGDWTVLCNTKGSFGGVDALTCSH